MVSQERFQEALEAFDEDEKRFGGQPKWDDWIREGRDRLDFEIRACGLTLAEVLTTVSWPTLGKYLNAKQQGGALTPHQDFLKTFTYGQWREYSAMAHGAFEGLRHIAMYYIADSFPHEERPKVDALHPRILTMHISRAALLLLCIITELQAYFRFDGANINTRIHEMWNALIPPGVPVVEARELYEKRYAELMDDKGIDAW